MVKMKCLCYWYRVWWEEVGGEGGADFWMVAVPGGGVVSVGSVVYDGGVAKKAPTP